MSRFWKATLTMLAAGTVLGITYDRSLRPWHQRWGMTRDELGRSRPGDELVPNACGESTHGITVNAPASQIWPWIVQIGQDRAGFYSYTQLENLFGCEMRNAGQIVPEWPRMISRVECSLIGSSMRQSALFRPRGLFGPAYWYGVLPFHAIVFRGMLSGIEREALKSAASPQDMVSETSI